MAELAEQRREARRRKILQNSEKRMNRLLGKQDDSEKESPVSTDESEKTTPSPTEGSVLHAPIADGNSGSGEIDGDTVSDRSSSPLAFTASSNVQSRPPLSSLKTSLGTQSPARTVSSSHIQQKKHTTQETQNLLQIMENMRLGSCVCIAFLIRWVLSSGYGIFYFQTIFLPFILLETGIYSFHYTYMKDVVLPHGSSMMSGALVLCGIKPELVAVYNRIMGYMTAVTEDFALYLFTFLVCNAVM